MIEVRVNLEGLAELKESFQKFDKDISEDLGKAMTDVMAVILSRAQHIVPVDTGRLRADIKTEINKERLEGKIYNLVFYSEFVHFGTRKMKARPYLSDSINQNKSVAEDRIKQRMELLAKRGLTPRR